MKTKTLLLALCALLFALCSCSTTRSAKTSLPFADTSKYGQNPVKKNKPVNKESWIHRQWGHEGR